jgi:integrase/recombinase XerD
MTTRERLERAFDLRGIAPGTREAYAFCIHRYERFFGRPAGALGREEVETFLIHLVRERKLSPGTHNVYAAALRFVYGAAFGRPG